MAAIKNTLCSLPVLRCLCPLLLTIYNSFPSNSCFKQEPVTDTCLLYYDYCFAQKRAEGKMSLLSTCAFHTFCGLAFFHYLIISVVMLAWFVASKSKLHDCFGLLCEVLEVCFSVIGWAEYSGKSEAGVGARVLRFLRHKMHVIQRLSASNIKGRSIILKIGYI